MNVRKLMLTALGSLAFANALLAIDALTLGIIVPKAEASGAKQEEHKPAAEGKAATEKRTPPDPAKEEVSAAYARLVADLTAQKVALDKRAADLAERERQFGVLKQELLAMQQKAPKAAAPATTPAAAAPPAAQPVGTAVQGSAFEKLLKAYDGMEAANAAAAMAELYAKNRVVCVDLLLGLKPRQSAAILDSLAATSPSIAAELSVEVYRRGGAPTPPTN